jgi:DNA-binding IclR family transcriptional regulator
VSQSLARGLRLLGELGDGPRSLDQLAASAGVHKTTVLRLLRVLEDQRFVYRDPGHRYHLGSQLFALSGRALDQRAVRAAASPHLAALNRATGHTVHLGAYESGAAVYLDKFDSRHPVQMYSRPGLTMPLHCTAIGKVLLAGLPPAERNRAVAGLDLTPLTPNTITAPADLLAELARVESQGYAADHAEHERFLNCLAAPVRDAAGHVAAAVSLSVPDVLLGYDEVLGLLPGLLATARAVSADCGYDPSHHPHAPHAEPQHAKP